MKVISHYYNQFRIFLGPQRFIALVALFIGTGLLSAFIAKNGGEGSGTATTLITLAFLAAAVIIIVGRMEGDARYRWGATLAPAVGLMLLAALFAPQYMLAAAGAGVGWVVAGTLIFGKSRAPQQYREAVKALRNNDYETGVREMDALIKAEPDEANHFRFRAELLRLWGKMDRARRDYAQMVNLAKDEGTRAVAYNGLAEVDLQTGKYKQALESAQTASKLAPDEWVAAYNLGMIQDRLAESGGVIDSLTRALQSKVPDSRHRLLIYLYLARAYSRKGDVAEAQAAVDKLKKERGGLREWEAILRSEQAQVIRDVLAKDVEAAKALSDGSMQVGQLAGGSVA